MALNLGKQLGPLPIGVWIGVGAVGLFIGYRVNKSQASGTSDEETTGIVGDSQVGVGGGQLIYDPPTNVESPISEATNHMWGLKATTWLVGQGINPLTADNAVRKYLSSEPLNAEEQRILNLAISQFGPAPEPLSPVDQPPTDTPPAAGGRPNPVVNLRLAGRAVKNNTISWHHDGKNGVTAFHILETNAATGKSTTVVKPARSGAYTVYTHTHTLVGSYNWKTRPKYTYLVRAFSGATPETGPGKKIGPYQHLI